jgi:hypothetical protein
VILLLISRLVRVTPRRYCIACGHETMKAYAPVRQALLKPLGMSVRSCRGCRRTWVAPLVRRQAGIMDDGRVGA